MVVDTGNDTINKTRCIGPMTPHHQELFIKIVRPEEENYPCDTTDKSVHPLRSGRHHARAREGCVDRGSAAAGGHSASSSSSSSSSRAPRRLAVGSPSGIDPRGFCVSTPCPLIRLPSRCCGNGFRTFPDGLERWNYTAHSHAVWHGCVHRMSPVRTNRGGGGNVRLCFRTLGK